MSFPYFPQILEAHTKVAEKTQIYVPYNILPLDPDSQNQAIMRYPEVSSATWLYAYYPPPPFFLSKLLCSSLS